MKPRDIHTGDYKMNENSTLLPRISYTNLDIAKFICSLLVIVIHTSPLVDYPIAQFYSVNVISRIAVPLFFGTTGFLLFGQMDYENGKLVNCSKNRTRMFRYWKKTIFLYLSWAVVYLLLLIPDWYQIGWWGWNAVKDALHAFFIKGMFGHLWYLISVIWAVPMLYLALRIISLRNLRMIAVVLWFLGSMNTTYGWLWDEQITLLTIILEIIPVLVTATSCALPLMVFGASLAVERNSYKKTGCLFKCLLLLGLWFLEASAIYFFVPNAAHFSSLLVTPFFVYYTLDFLISERQIPIPTRMQCILRETNTVIYCLHPLFIHLFKKFGMSSGILLWLFTTVITVGLASMWAFYKNRKNGR